MLPRIGPVATQRFKDRVKGVTSVNSTLFGLDISLSLRALGEITGITYGIWAAWGGFSGMSREDNRWTIPHERLKTDGEVRG